MKRWLALSKIEFLLTKRQLIYYLLSVGMPTAFYLFFSGMYQDTPGGPANFMRDYLISMTGFSMMSTAIFSFPAVLHTDKMNNWQKILRHSPVNMVEYYLSKITSMLVDYLVSILVVFTVGHFVRGVDMPLVKWVGAAILLILGSIAFVALGLTLTLLPTSQLMSVVGNLLYLGLAVLGGLWMPVSLFPDWMQAIGKRLPSYHFSVRSLKSLHVWTFLLAQVLVVGQLLIFQRIEVEFLFYLLVILTFVDLMTFGLVRIRIVEDLKEAQVKQNAQINLLLAENERSRIGQDLHDSLGHTFAMLSVKTDLALQLFQMEAYPQVEKELKEIHQISKDSMNEVRTIVENLKSRTLTSELETVKKMLEIAGIEVQVENHLDKSSLTQELESTASMILLELVTNIIKHAKASKVYLKLERTEKELILTVRDDGCGFASISGDELHTVRNRVFPFSGEVSVISQKHPTEVQVRLLYKERK